MGNSLTEIETGIRGLALEPRGAFHCRGEDQVPCVAPGVQTRTLVLIGTIGSGFWPAFKAARPALGAAAHPLDAYSRQRISELAERFAARALFPFEGPPWLPFLRWAERAENVHPSRLGPLIHPRYGLWHAYRGALAFAEELRGLHPVERNTNPCDRCVARPCLKACPAGAFNGNYYAVPACTGHLQDNAGQACMESGCLARQACPIGASYRYAPDHAAFHMRAFLRAQTAAPRGPGN